MARRFELVEGSASKFWEIHVEGSSHTVRYGRIGTNGQTKTKDFADEAAALASAEKLIQQKTKKGYAEVAEASEGAKPAERKSSAKKAPAKKPSAKKPSAKGAAKTKLPDLVVGSKKYGSRKLSNFAKKLEPFYGERGAPNTWKLAKDFGKDLPAVYTHLLTHGMVKLEGGIGSVIFTQVDFDAIPAERALTFLPELPESVAVRPGRSLQLAMRLDREVPEELFALYPQLPPSMQGAVALVRASRGAELTDEQRTAALSGLLAPLDFAKPVMLPGADGLRALGEDELVPALRELAGPEWFSLTPIERRVRLPWPILAEVTEGQTIHEVRYLLGWGKDTEVLAARPDAASAFFEAAEHAKTEKPTRVIPLTIAGMARAASPNEIPEGLEDECGPDQYLVRHQMGRDALAALGESRLTDYVRRHVEAERDILRQLWAGGLQLGSEALALILDLSFLRSESEAERWATNIQWGSPAREWSSDRLRKVVAAAVSAEGAGAVGLRRWAALLASQIPEDEEVPLEVDDLLEPANLHASYFKATRAALARLPAPRAEAVLVRSAPDFEGPVDEDNPWSAPYCELCFFRPRLSDGYCQRVARIIVEHQGAPMMWDCAAKARQAFQIEGARIAELIAAELGKSPSASMSENVRAILGEEAGARLEELAGKAESPREELRRVCAEAAGPRTPIYILTPTEEAASPSDAAYVGGRPRGVPTGGAPKSKGRALLHAFTVDLEAVPELSERHPGAKTLSFYIQAYTEDIARAQELVTRTREEVEADEGDLSDARRVDIERLEVPTAIFDEEPTGAVEQLRGLVYRQAGFLLGGPIWLQDGPPGADPSFLAQFDERLAVGANFGDAGIAYSFAHECIWQCH